MAACLILCSSSCKKTEDQMPKDISLSATTYEADVKGGTFDLTITSPARPKVTGMPEWITLKEGTFKDYKVTVTVTVAANTTTAKRRAALDITYNGVSHRTFTVIQSSDNDQPDTESTMPDTPLEISEAMGLGWNLGNHFDAYYNHSSAGNLYNYPSETVWGGIPATPQTFVGVKAAGFRTVRIPVTWLNMIGPAPDYAIDEAWISRVYEVVRYAHDAGLYVIINTHHDENHGDDHWLDIKGASGSSSLNQSIKEKITGVWTNIANYFKDCGDWLIMEGFNELNDGGWGWSADFRANPYKQTEILNDWNQVFVDAVRATGGNNATRWLGVPTYAANPEFTKYFTMPSDPAGKIMLSVHFYDPSDYTIGDQQYEQWGHTAQAGKKANGGDEDHVKSVFGKLKENYVSKGIPVYIGEFGCSLRTKGTTAYNFYLYYLEYVVKAARDYGMPCILWDNGANGVGKEQHGYINHGTGQIKSNADDAVAVMNRARYTDDASYTLESVYNSAPKP
jgi:endoglucanase